MATVPDSFPRPSALGSVTGVHPKVLATKVGERYITGPTDREIEERHFICADLADQLHAYGQRKLQETPSRSLPSLLDAIKLSVKSKGWGFSDPEIDWIMGEVDQKLSGNSPKSGNPP